MDLIAEQFIDVADQQEKMAVRLYKPHRMEPDDTWACKIEIDRPLHYETVIYGGSSMQALVLALTMASYRLYASDLYKSGKLGVGGVFGEDLFIPVTKDLLDVAPYPF